MIQRISAHVRFSERGTEREREKGGGGGSSPPSCCTSLLFRPSRAFHDVIATCFLLPLRERNPWNRPWMKSFRRKRNDRAHRGSLAHSRIHFRQLFLDNLVSFFLFLSFRGIAISDENFEGNYIRSEVGRGGRWDLGPIMTFLFFFFLWSKRPLTIFPVEIIGISLKFSFGENIFEIVKNLERDN